MQTMKSTFLLALLSIASLCGATQELTAETYQVFLDSGKNGMVKFFQNWCGHCKRMKPDWDRLAEDTNQELALIADVNCADQEGLCSEVGVEGYPTIKYYVDGKENDYNGGRSYEDLTAFVEETISPKCTFNDEAKTCSERSLKYIEKWSSKSVDQRQVEVKRLENLFLKEMKHALKNWVRERVGILKSSLDDKEL